MPIFGWSCAGSGYSTYTKAAVYDAVLSQSLLQVQVRADSAFYMAGANIISSTDDVVELKLIRCKVKKSCKVDISAKYNKETGFHELPVDAKSVKIDFGADGSRDVQAPN